jgi:hypothetical protein
MNQKNRDWIIWLGGIALLGCWGYGMAVRQAGVIAFSNRQPVTQSHQVAPANWVMMNVTTNWSEPYIMSRWRIEYHAITKDVWLQVRADLDNNRVYDVPPVNSGQHNVEIPGGSRSLEWRVRPGQAINEAKAVYQLCEPK